MNVIPKTDDERNFTVKSAIILSKVRQWSQRSCKEEFGRTFHTKTEIASRLILHKKTNDEKNKDGHIKRTHIHAISKLSLKKQEDSNTEFTVNN